MDRLSLERRQVWIYLVAIVCGLMLGSVAPGIRPRFEGLLWPMLAALLYTTFTQVPLLHVRDAFRDRRFVLAILLGNFVLIPLVAWLALLWLALLWLPDDPALRLGVLLVLLVPCTDWFITFTQLGRGNTARAIAVTPLNLLLQLLLLPFYLWLMLPAADFSAALLWTRSAALTDRRQYPLQASPVVSRIVALRDEPQQNSQLHLQNRLYMFCMGWWPILLRLMVSRGSIAPAR